MYFFCLFFFLDGFLRKWLFVLANFLFIISAYRNTMATILSAQQKWSIKVLMALVMLACHHNSIRVRSYLLRAALGPSLDAKSDCRLIRKNAGVSLSVLFWCIIFERRSLAIIRFLRCLRRSMSESLTYTVTIGFADITLSLAITRLTTKQSCWRRTLETTKNTKMDFNIWGLVN
jgi:hypothetical protein